MYPTLIIKLGDNEATEYEIQTLDVHEYDRMVHKTKDYSSEFGRQLYIAYTHLTGKQPKTFEDVADWARANEVRTRVGEDKDPTMRELSDD